MVGMDRILVRHFFHSSIQCTPFQALYGRDPSHLLRYERGTALVSSIDQMLEDRDTIVDDLLNAFTKGSTKDEILSRQ